MPIISGEPVVGALSVILNPTSQGYSAELDLNDGAPSHSGYVVLADPPPQLDAPQPSVIYADSFDTEGALAAGGPKYPNVERGFSVMVFGASSGDLEAKLRALYKAIGQVQREGGVLRWTTANETAIFFDLLPEASGGVELSETYLRNNRCVVTLRAMTLPFWRQAEAQVATASGTGVMVFDVPNVGGQVPALARLVIGSDADQDTVVVARASRYISDDATADWTIAGTDLTPLGTSTDTGTAIRNTNLVPTEQAIAEFEGTHKGSFRVWVRTRRPTSNTGAVTIALEWGEGDYLKRTRNDPEATTYAANDREGVDCWADLGTVHISPEADRWRFRPLASSTGFGDEIDIEAVRTFPCGAPGERDAYIELSAVQQFETPSDFEARDEFAHSAGNLADKTAPVGGGWDEAGSDTDGFMINTADATARRATVSDDIGSVSPAGRRAIAGTATLTNIGVQVDFKRSGDGGSVHQGVFARYTDESNSLHAYVAATPLAADPPLLVVYKADTGIGGSLGSAELPPLPADAYYRLRLVVLDSGAFYVWGFPRGAAAGRPVVAGHDAALATGGALASGKFGIYDANPNAGANTRDYDNFLAFVPTKDVAVFADQTLELGHNRARREDSVGTDFSKVSQPRGKYLTLPPAGLESRESRIIVAGYGNDPETMGNDEDAALTATLFAAARGHVVP